MHKNLPERTEKEISVCEPERGEERERAERLGRALYFSHTRRNAVHLVWRPQFHPYAACIFVNFLR